MAISGDCTRRLRGTFSPSTLPYPQWGYVLSSACSRFECWFTESVWIALRFPALRRSLQPLLVQVVCAQELLCLAVHHGLSPGLHAVWFFFALSSQ